MSLIFDRNSNLSLVRRFPSHYEKIIKMCQFYSDSSRFFFATNCTEFKNSASFQFIYFTFGPLSTPTKF
jgi:hypothetical protein